MGHIKGELVKLRNFPLSSYLFSEGLAILNQHFCIARFSISLISHKSAYGEFGVYKVVVEMLLKEDTSVN